MKSHKRNWGIILAAGFGTRMRPMTDKVPKPLIRVGDHALLDYAIKNMVDVGVNNIVVNGHYMWEQIRDHITQNWSIDGVTVHFIFEPEILETGGSIMNIMHKFDIDEALVSNSDCILLEHAKPALKDLVMFDVDSELVMLVQHYGKSMQGIANGDFMLVGKDKFIFDSVKRGDYIFLGSYIVKRSIFSDRSSISKFSMLDYIMKSSADEYEKLNYHVVKYEGMFLDVGTIQLFEKAVEILSRLKTV